MMHQAEHNVGDHEDPVAGPTWMVSVIGVILLVVIFLGLTALYYNYANSEAATKVLDRAAADFEAVNAAQRARIHGEARWQQRDAEIVDDAGTGDGPPPMEDHLTIPIEQAMQAVVQEYGKK
jgi:hypothetical protein